jgi:FkbM family methyltransferase
MENTGLLLIRYLTIPLEKVKGVRILVNYWRIICAKIFRKTIIIDDFDGDLKFECVLNEHMSSQIFWYGAYSGAELRVLEKYLPADGVFIDVGANQGEFSLFAAKRCSQVIAFEPSHFVDRLRKNIALNEISNIAVDTRALGDSEAIVTLFSAEEDSGDGTLNEGLSTLYPSEARSTASADAVTVTLDSYMDESPIKRLDVIKIDVEGGELSVLFGAKETLEKYKPVLIIEINNEMCISAGYSMDTLYDYIVSLGYHAFLIERNSLRPIAFSDLSSFQNILFIPIL